MAALWLQFLACSLLILVSGAQLLRQGDRIARLTGLGGTWIGVVLLATVTSLPELVSGVTAVTAANAPNLAVGDVLGSCVFNLAMIAVLDALQRPASVFLRSGSSHQLGAAFSIVTLALIGMGLMSHRWPSASLLSSDTVAPCLVLLYAMAMRAIFVQERSARLQQAAPRSTDPTALRRALARYGLAAAIVVAAAIWLPFVAAGLAGAMGWTESFVGTLMVAMATSLPELAVTIAAVRRGAVDMAIGNLLGSNLFNVVVLAVDSLLYRRGSLLDAASPSHIASVFAAIAMSAAVLLALIAPPRARLLNTVSGTSLLLLLLFFANAWFQLRHAG